MFDILTNAFLNNPIPVNLNLNYCSHGCVYCFANLNSPKRSAKIADIVSQFRNLKNRTDLVSLYMKEKYPVIVSNNIDPFSKSNIDVWQKIYPHLIENEIPIMVVTRGGVGWEQCADDLPKSVFYVSVPYLDDAKRQKYEPNAPTLESRFAMVKQLLTKHNVIVGINPIHKDFCTDYRQIMRNYYDIGVRNFWLNTLHLTPKQQTNLTENQKEIIGKDLLSELNKKMYSDSTLNILEGLQQEAKELDGVILHGLDYGTKNNINDIYSCYDKLLPTKHDFFNWCANNKKNGDLITFQMFFDFFADKLPNIETNISKFIFNKVVLDTKNSYIKQPLKNLLHYYWQTKGVELGLAKNYPVFSWAMKNYTSKQDFIFDTDGNKVLVYHPEIFNVKDFTIIK